MKYFSKLQCYKASNVVFDPIKMQAWSYDWWAFVKVIDGTLVFNVHRYSPTTQRHQRKVRELMQSLGIHFYKEVDTRKSLSEFHTINEVEAAHDEQYAFNCCEETAKRLERNKRARERRARQ